MFWKLIRRTSNFTPMVPSVPLGRERDMDWLSRGTKQYTVRLFMGWEQINSFEENKKNIINPKN